MKLYDREIETETLRRIESTPINILGIMGHDVKTKRTLIQVNPDITAEVDCLYMYSCMKFIVVDSV